MKPHSRLHSTCLYLLFVGMSVSLAVTAPSLYCQTPAEKPSSPAPQAQLETLASELAVAEDHLKQSQQEIDHLREQIAALREQLSAATSKPSVAVADATSSSSEDIKEEVAVLKSEVEQHDQIKVETASKYPVQLTGLVLFNMFTNQGAVDNFDQPSVAVVQGADTPSLASGASMRQTTIGIRATGPHLLGASSNAEINFDFYGGLQYINYGSTGGLVRLRTGAVRLLWSHDTAEIGLVEPLVSPLSPTSYASVAEPAMAWAGNLWTWAPQLRYRHQFGASSRGNFNWEFGLWDSPAAGYTNADIYRVPSAGERSGQPAYESRFSFNRGESGGFRQLQLGLGGYYSRQAYTGRSGDSWAVTGDWKIPFSHLFEWSGEAYRGRSLGGLGGGVYKDVIAGADPVSGKATFRLLNDVGGWTQGKLRFATLLEANVAFGMDNGFARDFHSLILPSTAGAVQLRARNQMVSANLIYTPKTYLIISPEYRRIRTYPINSSASAANIFTLSFGYRF
jgi:hypothetical protein